MAANGQGWTLAGIGVAVGLLIGYVAKTPEESKPNPEERALNADLYTQTAGEYRALCLQTYRLAWESLQQRIAAAPPGNLPLAVVMDLDETVLLNAGYQTWLYRTGQTYSDKTWAVWEEKYPDEVGLVPGAFEFIEKVERLDNPSVAVVYISNRRHREGTIQALKRLNLDRKGGLDKRLLLRINGSDKESRRKEVEKHYRILMLIGDNLADLSSVFYPSMEDKNSIEEQSAAIRDRLRKVNAFKERFGRDWIVLPNPIYGDWTLPLGNNPASHLQSTKFSP